MEEQLTQSDTRQCKGRYAGVREKANCRKRILSLIIRYTTEDGTTKIEVTFDQETVWLSVDQMAGLFQRDKSVIGKHVRNIFESGELLEESVVSKMETTAADGKRYKHHFRKNLE